nr:hypothetical protein Itr_chr13CG05970 [Ipomoea trifida]
MLSNNMNAEILSGKQKLWHYLAAQFSVSKLRFNILGGGGGAFSLEKATAKAAREPRSGLHTPRIRIVHRKT